MTKPFLDELADKIETSGAISLGNGKKWWTHNLKPAERKRLVEIIRNSIELARPAER